MIDVGDTTIAITHIDGVGRLPARQLTVSGNNDLVAPRPLPVVDDGRLAAMSKKTSAAKHAVSGKVGVQRGWVPRPMQHVSATHMHKGKRFLALPRLGDDIV